MSPPFTTQYPTQAVSDQSRFERAVAEFESINLRDPKRLSYEGADYPQEYLLSRALFFRILELEPTPSEPLMLAAHCQHLKRWEIPRNTYPEGRKGYLDWRSDLKVFHAKESSTVLSQCGYEPAMLEAVSRLNHKDDIKGNADCQTLEDGLCLVFLEFQFDDLLDAHPPAKVKSILAKTAKKMSPRGLARIETLPMTSRARLRLEESL